MSEWISVESKLPVNDEKVIIFIKSKDKNYVRIGYVLIEDDEPFWYELGEENFFEVDYKVTHWMNLPEEPK